MHFTFKMRPRSLSFIENWWSYKIIGVHLLFLVVFYHCVHISVSNCPNNMFLGLFQNRFFRATHDKVRSTHKLDLDLQFGSRSTCVWTWTRIFGVRQRRQVQDRPLDSLGLTLALLGSGRVGPALGQCK
jgi:hypothetical protein